MQSSRMPHGNPVVLAVVLSLAASAGVRAAEKTVAVPAGQAQMFVDDGMIAAQSGLQRTLHQPRKDHAGQLPIIASNPGDYVMAYGSIAWDPRLEKYVMLVRRHRGHEYFRTVSDDGLQWEATRQSELQPIHFDNPVQPEEGTNGRHGYDLFSFHYDTRNAEFPYQGWLYLSNYGDNTEGIYHVFSADGIAWKVGRQVLNAFASPEDATSRSITQDGKTVFGPGDVTSFYYDEVTHKYLALIKFFTTTPFGETSSLRSRAYLWLDRMDEPVDLNRIQKIALMPEAADRNGDRRYDEYYGSTAWRYESLFLGELKIFHPRGTYPYSAAGSAYFKLAVSRNGTDWKKVPFANDAGIPEVFIPNGEEGGNGGRNDGGYMCPFPQGPMRIGDELVFYYSCSSWGKNNDRDIRVSGGGIFRARLRVDGFVSVDAGTLTTPPLSFEGQDLYVNSVGPVTVEVLDGSRSLGSYELDGDSIRHRVRFAGKSLAELAPSGEAQLRFSVQERGQLYSFTVR